MPDVGKHLVLHGEERATGVNEVDARQVVLVGDGLRPNVFLDRHGVVGAALDRGVVRNEQALTAVHHADAGDDPGRVGSPVVEFVGGQRREFQKAVPGSTMRSMRSRARCFPRERCRSTYFPPPPCEAVSKRSCSSVSRARLCSFER